MTYDVFISHASDDKEEFVRQLAEVLIESGWEVWYDELSLNVGDSLRQSIDTGLRESRFGLVVLSESFFRKQWTDYELNGLVAKMTQSGERVVLPIWHKVSHQEVMNYSPALADTVALNSSMPMHEIVAKLSKVLGPPRRSRDLSALNPLLRGDWIQEPCPRCGEDADHIGIEQTTPDGAWDIDWIACKHCGYKSEPNEVRVG